MVNGIINYCIVVLIIFLGCKNPFAPAFDDNPDSNESTLSDQKTIDGVFQNFQYAYTFKDTLIYGGLINHDFIFTFRNFNAEIPFDDSWGRDEEMRTTYGLFQNAQRLDLIWNNIVSSTTDSLSANIVRSFNLTVTLNPTDIIRIDGRVNLTLSKNINDEKWRITRWFDDSNF